MSAPQPPKNPYAYLKPSTIATRSLISPTTNMGDGSNTSSSADASLGSTGKDYDSKGTSNYEQAAATARSIPGVGSTSGSGSGSGNDSNDTRASDRPGVARQASWRMSDFRGAQQQGRMGAEAGQGYSSTGAQVKGMGS